MLSRTEQFAMAHEVVRCTLSELQGRLAGADVLQPDVPSKKTKAQQLGVRPLSTVGCFVGLDPRHQTGSIPGVETTQKCRFAGKTNAQKTSPVLTRGNEGMCLCSL